MVLQKHATLVQIKIILFNTFYKLPGTFTKYLINTEQLAVVQVYTCTQPYLYSVAIWNSFGFRGVSPLFNRSFSRSHFCNLSQLKTFRQFLLIKKKMPSTVPNKQNSIS